MKRFTLSILVLFFSSVVLCQIILPTEVTASKPEVLKPKHGVVKKVDVERELCPDCNWGQNKTINEFWIVRSDRSRNPLYADAAKSRLLNSTLSFNERVIIAEVKSDMALVYTDDKMERYPVIPSYAKSRGWIPMENLLLWDKCPADQRGILPKVLMGMNLKRVSMGNEFNGKVYMDPVSTREPRGLLMDMNNIYFIMKESRDGKRVLLCQDPTVFGRNLYGWVDNTVFSRWDQRACLEPNWDPDYADSHKGQNVSVYADQQMSSGNKVTCWEFGKPNGDNDRWNQYRMAPNQLRFPIIERPNHEKNYAHCIAFITYGSASQDFLERYLGKTAYEKWKKINCVSMFDGYVKLKDMEGNNIWNYICCFSGDELRYLLYELKELYETAKCNADDRKHYINAMRKVIKYHSIDNNDVYINSMSIKEIKGTIYGLDLPVEIGNSLWSKFTIKDFADPKVVTNIEFRKSLGQFSEKYERLQRIVGDGYKYRILLGNEYYYWIPVEDLP